MIDKCNSNILNFSHGKKGCGHLRELPGMKKLSPGYILIKRV